MLKVFMEPFRQNVLLWHRETPFIFRRVVVWYIKVTYHYLITDQCVGIKGIALKWYNIFLFTLVNFLHLLPLFFVESPKGPYWAPCCFLCIYCPWGIFSENTVFPFIIMRMIYKCIFPVKTNDKVSFLSLLNCLRDLKSGWIRTFFVVMKIRLRLVVLGI